MKKQARHAVTFDTSHFEMSSLKDDTYENLGDVPVAFDTSHFEMSPLKDDTHGNLGDVSDTFDMSPYDMPLFEGQHA